MQVEVQLTFSVNKDIFKKKGLLESTWRKCVEIATGHFSK